MSTDIPMVWCGYVLGMSWVCFVCGMVWVCVVCVRLWVYVYGVLFVSGSPPTIVMCVWCVSLCDSPHSLVLLRLAACTNMCAARRIRLPTCGSPHTTAHVRLAAISNTCAARRIRLHPCGSPQFVAHVRLAALSNTCAARRIMTCAACHNVHTICVCSCFGFGGASVFFASVFSPTTTSHVTECWVCSFVRHAGSW